MCIRRKSNSPSSLRDIATRVVCNALVCIFLKRDTYVCTCLEKVRLERGPKIAGKLSIVDSSMTRHLDCQTYRSLRKKTKNKIALSRERKIDSKQFNTFSHKSCDNN